jgi:hypothetical protein
MENIPYKVTEETGMKSLRQQIEDLACEIDGDVHHGECFYEEDMLNDFCKNLDRMKKLARRYYEAFKVEMEDE